jgi:uncharacterized protein (TIGR02996 family)
MQAPYRCPRCGSRDVRDGKTGLGGAALYEFTCRRCGLAEERRSDAADLDPWWARWTAPPEAAAAAAVPAVARDVVAPAVAPDALLAAVTADPASDAPRLAYADALAATAPARAELVRLQVARHAAERASGALRAKPAKRERALLAAHGADWARYVEPYAVPTDNPAPDPGWTFERGFVGRLRVAPATLVGLGARLFALAPLAHLDLAVDARDGDDAGALRAALTSPLLGRLRTFAAASCGLTDDDAAALAANPAIAGLAWLDLRDNRIGDRGVRALAASAAVRAIPIVLLGGNPCDPGQQVSLDFDGSIADSWIPPAGEALEAAHGPIPWIHLPPAGDLPDREHAQPARQAPG